MKPLQGKPELVLTNIAQNFLRKIQAHRRDRYEGILKGRQCEQYIGHSGDSSDQLNPRERNPGDGNNSSSLDWTILVRWWSSCRNLSQNVEDKC